MRLNEVVFLRRFGFAAALAAVLSTVVGCGGGKGTVTGKVTVDGKPLPSGRISFVPSKGQGVGGEIKDGQYTVEKVPVGSVKVTVETKSLKERINALTVAAQMGSQMPPNMQGKGDLPKGAKEGMEEERKKNQEIEQELKTLQATYMFVPEKYEKQETSGFSLEVKSGSNTFDVSLSSK